MSSQNCAPAPAEPGGLSGALVSVAERSFFAFAEPAPPDASLESEGGWYEATVSFAGGCRGRVTLGIPRVLAAELAAAFLGAEPDDVPDEAACGDLAGEFANMAC